MELPCGDEYMYKEGGLYVGDASVAEVAQALGTPLYLYSGKQIQRNIAMLREQMKRINKGHQDKVCIYYAMKANRFRQVMDLIRDEKDIGIDACSPAEVEFSKECGFQSHEISFTGCFLSNSDIQRLVKQGVHVNFDTLTAIRKYSKLVPPNTKIGLRINPGHDLGISPDLKYTEKFGFSMDQFDDVLTEVAERGLVIDSLHFHSGWNYPEKVLPSFETTLAVVLKCALKLGPSLEVVDVGGGLGVLHHSSHGPSMTIPTWAHAIETHLMQPLRKINKNVRVVCEPGTRLVADAGLLVAEVNTVETRGSINWIGINAGKNLNCYQTAYGMPLTVLSVKGDSAYHNQLNGAEVTKETKGIRGGRGREEEEWETYCIAGNINEGCDMFGSDVRLPRVEDGDYLALFPCGAYGSSMMSNHCMRGGTECKERLIKEGWKR